MPFLAGALQKLGALGFPEVATAAPIATMFGAKPKAEPQSST